MTKPLAGALLTTLTLRPGAELPLHRQLYLRIRELILGGSLPRDSRLPSTRTLAAELHLSRNTVVNAIEQLVAEGYLVSRVGDGTYVAPEVPDEELRPVGRPPAAARGRAPEAALSDRGRRIVASPVGRSAVLPRPFAAGIPALDAFPVGLWHRLWLRRSRELAPDDLAYGDPAGHRPLREQIAAYLSTARGVDCTADRVLVVSSAQQAIDLTARVLLDPGDEVWLEEPGYLGARGVFSAAGARIAPVPVDGDGLDVDAGIAVAPQARLVYVTPSHQFPTGASLGLGRRLALLEWAASSGAWILEDDYDSEFRYSGRPLAALQGLDRSDRVIYVGTFAKVLYPSLRVAYLVVPERLVDAFVAARGLVDRHTPILPQLVLAEFMAAGHFASHLRRMRALYVERQAALRRALAERLGDGLRPRPDPAGMHLVLDLPERYDEGEVVVRCAERHVEVSPLSRYYLGPERKQGLLLGYACVDPQDIRSGVERLAAAL